MHDFWGRYYSKSRQIGLFSLNLARYGIFVIFLYIWRLIENERSKLWSQKFMELYIRMGTTDPRRISLWKSRIGEISGLDFFLLFSIVLKQ